MSGQAILDRAEVRTVAPALADVERRLAKVAAGRIQLAQIGQVIEPALLGTGPDIEIDTLNRLERANRIFATLEDVMDRLGCRAALPALVVAPWLAPAVRIELGAVGNLAPLVDAFAGKRRPQLRVDDRVHRARVVHLVGRDGRCVGRSGPRMREHLCLERCARHAGSQNLRDARVLVAQCALEVFPLRIGRVPGRIQRIERDVARAACGTDQERRLDRTVGQPVERSVARLRVLRQNAAVALPARQAAIDLEPARLVEAGVRKLAVSQCAGRRPKGEIARRLALVLGFVVWIRRIDRRFLVVAGRIAIARLADVLKQFLVTWAPLEAVGLLEVRGGTALRPWYATPRVVDDSPRRESVTALAGIEHAIPVDQHVDALLKDVGVKARIARRGLVPNLAPGALRRRQVRLAGIEAGIVGLCLARVPARARRGRGRRCRRGLRDDNYARCVSGDSRDPEYRAQCKQRDRKGEPFHVVSPVDDRAALEPAGRLRASQNRPQGREWK